MFCLVCSLIWLGCKKNRKSTILSVLNQKPTFQKNRTVKNRTSNNFHKVMKLTLLIEILLKLKNFQKFFESLWNGISVGTYYVYGNACWKTMGMWCEYPKKIRFSIFHIFFIFSHFLQEYGMYITKERPKILCSKISLVWFLIFTFLNFWRINANFLVIYCSFSFSIFCHFDFFLKIDFEFDFSILAQFFDSSIFTSLLIFETLLAFQRALKIKPTLHDLSVSILVN